MLAQRLHFNTFGGNPVCSAGGRAVLRAIDEDGIQANSAKVLRWAPLAHKLAIATNAAVCALCPETSPAAMTLCGWPARLHKVQAKP